MGFVARRHELAVLGTVTAAARSGRGGAVVVLGEAGIGKSALLAASTAALDGWTVLHADGSEFEHDVPFAALHRLCAPALGGLTDLPQPQRRALESVFGLGPEAPHEPLVVALAGLGLLDALARERPVCCVLDDVHWIDEQSRRALAFVARRLSSERIAMIFAARSADRVPELADLPRLGVTGLGDEDVLHLLRSTARPDLDGEVLDRIRAEAHGNPLALVEFARDAGPLGLPRPGVRDRDSLAAELSDQFVRRVERLPAAARSLVELAAAEPVGDMAVLRRAAGLLDLDPAGFAEVEDAGLVALGPRLTFRHPLVRSAIHAVVAPSAFRRVHAALAEATDGRTDPDRRAWHRADAAIEPDAGIARELDRSADRARSRGGLAACATYLERAAELTPEPGDRVARMLRAARARLDAGAPADARALVVRAERLVPADDGADRRRAARVLRARIGMVAARTVGAVAQMVGAAEGTTDDEAREILLEAFAASMYQEGGPGRHTGLARSIRERAPRRSTVRPVDLLLDALLDQCLLPVEGAVPAMRLAVTTARAATVGDPSDAWWMSVAGQLAMDLGDEDALAELADRQVELARGGGAVAALSQALRYQALARTGLGRFTDAATCLAEARAIDEASGITGLVGAELVLAGWSGDVDRHRELRAELRTGGPDEVVADSYATAVLYNGLGRYDAALGSALAAEQRRQAGSYVVGQLDVELVEAAARSGRPGTASAAMDRMEALAAANPTPWAVAQALHGRALLERGNDVEALHRDAIDRYSRSRARGGYARARLTFGEWLRRAGRRAEARAELRAAHELLDGMGARSFAERAARELSATGERPRRASADPLDTLTAQERLIAREVASGATSREVAGILFLSTRTVDTHLRNIYRKLGITSRRQLRAFGP
ncbi:AAA family ATPase [Pseudonocardia sp. HH130630-07]|uniref:AAA family ATPase n=1 Tax=Pseudonocardia sp. HH130630-07 TaxID=1690815 RepID=UPI000814B89B|nr:LuxR family transcriptional regulator [Pseudonocardia sp. HH130630-07]ANY07886.1 hypothetical protein AFB00_18050 [Pseudonocardia sp. HH130630-07]